MIFKLNCVNIFIDFEASTSIVDVDGTKTECIKQNFVKLYYLNIQDIPKAIKINDQLFKLRGAIIFHGGHRIGLRESNGHYTACALRTNQTWENYDDTKIKINNMRLSCKYNVEFLIFTI